MAPRLLTLAVLITLAALAFGAAHVFAADPGPTLEPVVLSGDPRSDGGGPGIVGSPLVILLGVVGLGLATVVVTLVLVRLTQRD